MICNFCHKEITEKDDYVKIHLNPDIVIVYHLKCYREEIGLEDC